MSLNLSAIMAAVADDAMASGLFERSLTNEPNDAPGNGLTFATWGAKLEPVPARSGLNTTSTRILVNLRLYLNANARPLSGVDAEILGAADALMAAYSGAFTLGGLVAEVDLLGEYGQAMSGVLAYATHNQKLYRIFSITLPLISNDTWAQAS